MEGNSIAMKKDFESGRSMVEMLGTLAIIGVLSIGGIAGYSYGMDKYKANQTINDVMLMGVDMITPITFALSRLMLIRASGLLNFKFTSAIWKTGFS